MTVQEIKEFLDLLSKLDEETQMQIFYMIKGAALVAHGADG